MSRRHQSILALIAATTLLATVWSLGRGSADSTPKAAVPEPTGRRQVVIEPPSTPADTAEAAWRSQRVHATEVSEDTARRPRRPAGERAAREVVQRFVRALLAYELRPGTRAARAEIRRSATPALARRILGEPPRAPKDREGPSRGRAVKIELLTGNPSRIEFVVTVRRGRAETGLVVTAIRQGERWATADLR